MDAELSPLLIRIAEALERLAPPAPPTPDFSGARLFRHDPATAAFHPAPDYPLALDSLIGIERQKTRFLENLERFANGLPYNHALLWGVRGTGKSSISKAAFMLASELFPGPRTPHSRAWL
jgi:predicted AAA+ superfamily ATPase